MAKRTRKLPNVGLDRFSGVYLWVVFIVIFTIWSPQIFPTMSTVHSVASQQAVGGMLAIAVLIPLACGCFDLSVGATANLTGIAATLLQVNRHWPVGYAILASLRERSDGAFDLPEGTIYPALHRLEEAGLLGSTWADTASRKRRVYALTDKGVAALAAERREWRRFAAGVQAVVGWSA